LIGALLGAAAIIPANARAGRTNGRKTGPGQRAGRYEEPRQDVPRGLPAPNERPQDGPRGPHPAAPMVSTRHQRTRPPAPLIARPAASRPPVDERSQAGARSGRPSGRLAMRPSRV
jgi:hypothetical protein